MKELNDSKNVRCVLFKESVSLKESHHSFVLFLFIYDTYKNEWNSYKSSGNNEFCFEEKQKKKENRFCFSFSFSFSSFKIISTILVRLVAAFAWTLFNDRHHHIHSSRERMLILCSKIPKWGCHVLLRTWFWFSRHSVYHSIEDVFRTAIIQKAWGWRENENQIFKKTWQPHLSKNCFYFARIQKNEIVYRQQFTRVDPANQMWPTFVAPFKL